MPEAPVAIITAASRGMGAACARLLAERGYRLVLLARGEDVTDLAEELNAVAVVGSVTDPDALAATVDGARSAFGRIDAVVNNTGHPPKGSLLELSDQQWHDGLDLLLLNVTRMAQLVTPRMIDQRGGSIVNISTFGAEEPSAKFPISSALRAALSAYVKMFADTHAASGVRMNNVLPGFIDSYPVDHSTISTIPIGRAGTVAEIAHTVAFLLSDDASYITGQNLRVDGGLTRSL